MANKTAREAVIEIGKALREEIENLKKSQRTYTPEEAVARVSKAALEQIAAYKEELAKMQAKEVGEPLEKGLFSKKPPQPEMVTGTNGKNINMGKLLPRTGKYDVVNSFNAAKGKDKSGVIGSEIKSDLSHYFNKPAEQHQPTFGSASNALSPEGHVAPAAHTTPPLEAGANPPVSNTAAPSPVPSVTHADGTHVAQEEPKLAVHPAAQAEGPVAGLDDSKTSALKSIAQPAPKDTAAKSYAKPATSLKDVKAMVQKPKKMELKERLKKLGLLNPKKHDEGKPELPRPGAAAEQKKPAVPVVGPNNQEELRQKARGMVDDAVKQWAEGDKAKAAQPAAQPAEAKPVTKKKTSKSKTKAAPKAEQKKPEAKPEEKKPESKPAEAPKKEEKNPEAKPEPKKEGDKPKPRPIIDVKEGETEEQAEKRHNEEEAARSKEHGESHKKGRTKKAKLKNENLNLVAKSEDDGEHYNYYLVHKDTGKVHGGYEYKEDAKDAASDHPEASKIKVQHRTKVSPEAKSEFHSSNGIKAKLHKAIDGLSGEADSDEELEEKIEPKKKHKNIFKMLKKGDFGFGDSGKVATTPAQAASGGAGVGGGTGRKFTMADLNAGKQKLAASGVKPRTSLQLAKQAEPMSTQKAVKDPTKAIMKDRSDKAVLPEDKKEEVVGNTDNTDPKKSKGLSKGAECMEKKAPSLSGKDSASKMMMNHALTDAAKQAKNAKMPTRQQSIKMPTPEEHAKRAQSLMPWIKSAPSEFAKTDELWDKKLKKSAPPGYSEDTMHKLKRKYGEESAFKIAWASYDKKNGKKPKKKHKKSESLEKKHIGFDKLKNKVEHEGYSEESAAKIAAAEGDKKYGKKGMARKAAAARKGK